MESKREQEVQEIEDAIKFMDAETLQRLEAAIKIAMHDLIEEDR